MYDQILAQYEKGALKTTTSLSFLAFGQNAIFGAALTAVMILASQGIVQGEHYLEIKYRNVRGVSSFCRYCTYHVTTIRHPDSGRPGHGQRSPLPTLHSPQLPWLCLPRHPPVPHRHAEHVQSPQSSLWDQGKVWSKKEIIRAFILSSLLPQVAVLSKYITLYPECLSCMFHNP